MRLFMKKSDIRQSHWLGHVNIYLNIIKIYFKSYALHLVSENFDSARLFIKKSGINIYMYAKYSQIIPCSLKAISVCE